MFIQIAPRVKVFVTEEDMLFIRSHSHDSFRSDQLTPEELTAPSAWLTRPYSSGRNLTPESNML